MTKTIKLLKINSIIKKNLSAFSVSVQAANIKWNYTIDFSTTEPFKNKMRINKIKCCSSIYISLLVNKTPY